MTTATKWIRWMIRRDMPDVLDIENGDDGSCWTEEELMSCLRQRNAIGMVVEVENEIRGFMVYELQKSHLRILKMAVRNDLRRSGIGSAMVDKMVSKLGNLRGKTRTEIRYMCRERNLSAQLFLRACGFRCREVCRDEFDDGDGFLMVRELNEFGPEVTKPEGLE